jgi:hypothetical protein
VSYRRVFEAITPPTGTSWVAWRIEEASTPTDDAATIIEGPTPFSPATTPSDPPTVTLETDAATLSEGWYRVQWLDADGLAVATAWQQYRALSPYAPSVGDIAAIMHARLVEDGGFRVANFTDETNPTAQQVQQIIALHTPLIFARLGSLDTLACANAGDLRAAATSLAAQRVKVEVESSYWPEEFRESADPAEVRAAIEADLASLVTAVESCRAGADDETDADSDSRTDPAFYFPPALGLRP